MATNSPPPYPSAARLSDSLCYAQYSASLKCLEEFSTDKSKCQEHFDVYKECKKRECILGMENELGYYLEREARLERNRKRSFFQ